MGHNLFEKQHISSRIKSLDGYYNYYIVAQCDNNTLIPLERSGITKCEKPIFDEPVSSFAVDGDGHVFAIPVVK